MKNAEKAVRDAATNLHDAIAAARKEGLAVAWPHRADGLKAIAISETGRSAETTKPAEKPAADKPAEKPAEAAPKAAGKAS